MKKRLTLLEGVVLFAILAALALAFKPARADEAKPTTIPHFECSPASIKLVRDIAKARDDGVPEAHVKADIETAASTVLFAYPALKERMINHMDFVANVIYASPDRTPSESVEIYKTAYSCGAVV
jgi:hypothetical protein